MAKNIYITEEQKKYIIESAGDLEYHFTTLRALCGMMETDTFNLEENGDRYRQGKYYMSLSRVRSSAEGYGRDAVRLEDGPGVRIELDGRKLNNVRHINVTPYNYFNNVVKHDKNINVNGALDSENYSEFEDSVTLKNGESQIKDAVDYVIRVDILLREHIGEHAKDWSYFLNCLNTFPDWASKMHFFSNVADFDNQRNEMPKSKIYGLYSEEFKQALEESNQKMGKRIYITESQLSQILKENELLLEAKTKVDNFDMIGDLINLTDPDKFYFVQIAKRWKDNKDKNGADTWRQNGRQAGTYHMGSEHGNFASGTAFKVHNKQELLALKPQIVSYCEQNNARAYITCNPRSEKAINAHLDNLKQKFGSNLHSWDQKYGFEHMAGQAKEYDAQKWPDRVRFILDIDIEQNAWYLPGKKLHCKKALGKDGKDHLWVDDTAYPKLHNCEASILPQSHAQLLFPKYPNQEAEISALGGLNVWDETKRILAQNNVPIEKEYGTPSKGLHIVVADISKIQNLKKFEQDLRVFDDGRNVGRFQLVHINMDGKLILYSNVDTSGY